MSDWRSRSHRRYNPLTGDWVLVSPQRLSRPWQGESSAPEYGERPAYDPACYLCPGNQRANGKWNPRYDNTFVFDNDFAALQPDGASRENISDGLLVAAQESGYCRVVCFSPRHDLDIATMDPEIVLHVIEAWVEQYVALGSLSDIGAVTIFENRGAMMGASNPHPHGQIWANQSVPNELLRETRMQRDYLATHGECLLCTYGELERRNGERIVRSDTFTTTVVPFWATWPYETLVLPARHVASIDALETQERESLARSLHDLAARYDRVFSALFPYSMGFHQRPTDGGAYDQWHMHAHYYPPLLRSSGVRKYAVGYEMLAQPQRDITPEDAARRLREA